MRKLRDLHDAGLVDLETFRTRPCLTWIATGSWYGTKFLFWISHVKPKTHVLNASFLFLSFLFCSSPFGKRCSSIHDPRVQGAYPSWLTHTETQGNTIATDINVDGLYQKNQNHILHGTPFGDLFSLEHDSWPDLYRIVCNLDGVATSSALPTLAGAAASSSSAWTVENSAGRRRTNIHPLCKLKIALLMRGNNPDWQYKYRPKHVIHDELCMVLQKRAFCIKTTVITTEESTVTSVPFSQAAAAASSQCYSLGYDVTEIPMESYKKEKHNHVLVHELAFGPDSDPQVSRPVSLFYNIDEQKVVECTSTQAKRFRWKRGIKKKDSPISGKAPAKQLSSQNSNQQSQPPSAFSFMESFVMIRPHDKDAYELATAILEHRVAYMTKELIPNMKERHEVLEVMKQSKRLLQNRFENLRKHWIAWSWPINSGREIVTRKTPVPPVDGKYNLSPPPPSFDDKEAAAAEANISDDTENPDPPVDGKLHVGSQVRRIWDSFVSKDNLLSIKDEVRHDISK